MSNNEKQQAAFDKYCRPNSWKKGQSGNPSGRHRGTFRKEVDELIREMGAQKVRRKDIPGKVYKTRLEVLVYQAFVFAEKGDISMMQYLINRIGGKPVSKIELTGAEGGPLQHRIEYEPLLDDEPNEDDQR